MWVAYWECEAFPFFQKRKEKGIVAFVALSVDCERCLWPTSNILGARWPACARTEDRTTTHAFHVASPDDVSCDDMAATWLCFLLFLVVNFRVLKFLWAGGDGNGCVCLDWGLQVVRPAVPRKTSRHVASSQMGGHTYIAMIDRHRIVCCLNTYLWTLYCFLFNWKTLFKDSCLFSLSPLILKWRTLEDVDVCLVVYIDLHVCSSLNEIMGMAMIKQTRVKLLPGTAHLLKNFWVVQADIIDVKSRVQVQPN